MGILSALFGSGPKPVNTPFSNVTSGTVNNNTTGSMNGGYTGNQTGTQTGNTTGNQTGWTTGNQTGTTTAIAPDGYLPDFLGLRPGAGGFTPGQTTGMNWFGDALASPDPGGLSGVRGYFQDTLNNRQAPTLRNLAQQDPNAYGAPSPVSAQQVNSQAGAQFMDAYKNPYLSEVLDSSLSDFDTGVDRAGNSFRAGNIAGGVTGGRYGSNPVGSAILAGEAARGRGALSSGIRSDAFNTAAGYGMQDANRDLSAQSTNATNTLSADTFNNNMTNNRQQFDANLGMQYNDQRDGVARNMGELGVLDLGLRQDLAGGMFDMGGQGFNQNMNWLGGYSPLFGTQNTNNSTGTTNNNTTGTQTGTTTGTTNGTTFQDTTGTQNGTTTGNSSGYGTQMQPGNGGLVGALGPLAMGAGMLGWNPFASTGASGPTVSGGGSTGYVW